MEFFFLFFLEKIHCFFIVWSKNLIKTNKEVDLIFIQFKEIVDGGKFYKNKINFFYKWANIYLLYSKKNIKIFGKFNIEFDKNKKIYFPKNPSIDLIFIELDLENFVNLKYEKHLNHKMGIVKKLKKRFLTLDSKFSSNFFFQKLNFRVIENEIYFFKNLNFQYLLLKKF
jgi:hypothetical protein